MLLKFGSKPQKTWFEPKPNQQFRFRFSTYPEPNLQFSFWFRKCQKYAELLPYKARVQVQTRFETRPNWQFSFWFSQKGPKLDFGNTKFIYRYKLPVSTHVLLSSNIVCYPPLVICLTSSLSLET